ncbi:MAG: FAD-dependent oxidoreductase [Woeseiaceae bacterium]
MTKTSLNITVIGAGINGLVAANYLARAGHKVTLLESKDWVGMESGPVGQWRVTSTAFASVDGACISGCDAARAAVD